MRFSTSRYVPVAITMCAVLVLGSTATAVQADSPRAGSTSETPPNVVVILTDDQPKGMLAAMPTVTSELLNKGTYYRNAVIPTSVCCPSRTSLLTGLYSNQSGVFGNAASREGGYSYFEDRGNENRTLATKLASAGYTTGLFGKYLNEYSPYEGILRPAGWDRFQTFDSASRSGFYTGYKYTDDAEPTPLEESAGQPLTIKDSGDEYSTTHFGRLTSQFIQDAPTDKPLFAMYTPYAPHGDFVAEQKYAGTGLTRQELRTNPAVNEKNLKDKPRWIKALNNVPEKDTGPTWTKQTETLRSVDDEVGRILEALRATSRLDNTVIVFASDNGYMYGEHRIAGKNMPYRSSTDVDLIVRQGAGLAVPQVSKRLVTANVDVSATILAQAGLPNTTSGTPVDSVEYRYGIPVMGSRTGPRPAYCGWRTASTLYVRYGTGEEEFYDYRDDPFELTNNRWKKRYAVPVKASIANSKRVCTKLPPSFGRSFSKPRGGLAKDEKQAIRKSAWPRPKKPAKATKSAQQKRYAPRLKYTTSNEPDVLLY